ncbi:MAG: hypothetical protein WBE76_27385 [Terracidiphilus sp.]
MSDKWTPQERYADTKRYLEGVDAGLASHVHKTLPISTVTAGTQLSLAGNPRYAMFGSSAVGRAVRALRLCHLTYLGTNWARQTGGADGIANNLNSQNGATLTMDFYLSKSEAVVREAIMAFVALNPGLATVADAAELVGNGSNINPPFEKMTRAQNPFPSGQVCFNCVYWWLFKSGYVSLRWILHKGMALGAENANRFLGDGTPVTLNHDGSVPNIPRGTVLNWRGTQQDTRDICHWAVSLGDGFAVGANNTLAGKIKGATKAEDQDIDVRFRYQGHERTMQHDDSKFGTFRIEDMCRVYAGVKSQSNSTGLSGYVLTAVNPINIPNRNLGE